MSFDTRCWLITYGGKKVKRPLVFKLTQHHTKNRRLGSYFSNALFFLAIDVPAPRYGRIYNILLDDKGYNVIIGNFPGLFMCLFSHNIGKFFGWLWGVCAM